MTAYTIAPPPVLSPFFHVLLDGGTFQCDKILSVLDDIPFNRASSKKLDESTLDLRSLSDEVREQSGASIVRQ